VFTGVSSGKHNLTIKATSTLSDGLTANITIEDDVPLNAISINTRTREQSDL